VRGTAHERAHKIHGGNTTVARKHTDADQRLRIVLRGEGKGLAAANCALYTIVALSRLTPIDLLSSYKVM